MKRFVIILFFVSFSYNNCLAQKNGKDSIQQISDSSKKQTPKKHIPRIATQRSAILPGWGQAYNKEYWKIPIVYAFLGTTAGVYIYNNNWYKKTKLAYEIRVTKDTARFSQIDPQLEPLDESSLQFYRNAFRKNKDYSVLYFLLGWGLNVLDATVFGHLKAFDVSDNLAFKIKPTFQGVGNSVNTGLAFEFTKPSKEIKSVK
jgi:hypothetical protein